MVMLIANHFGLVSGTLKLGGAFDPSSKLKAKREELGKTNYLHQIWIFTIFDDLLLCVIPTNDNSCQSQMCEEIVLVQSHIRIND